MRLLNNVILIFRKLHLAIAKGDDIAVHYLIAVAHSCSSSHLLDIRDKQHGHTALHLVVAADRPSIVRLLIVAGASPNVRSRRGRTPLLVACARGLLRCISLLLRPVDDDERARLTKYCTDVRLPASQLPLPPVYLPETNLLDCEGKVLMFICITAASK